MPQHHLPPPLLQLKSFVLLIMYNWLNVHAHTHTNFLDKNIFKKSGMHLQGCNKVVTRMFTMYNVVFNSQFIIIGGTPLLYFQGASILALQPQRSVYFGTSGLTNILKFAHSNTPYVCIVQNFLWDEISQQS